MEADGHSNFGDTPPADAEATLGAQLVVEDARRAFGGELPDWIAWAVEGAALRLAGFSVAPTFASVCADALKRSKNIGWLREVVRLSACSAAQTWAPAEDQLDGTRLELALSVMHAARPESDAPFQLFSPARLLTALDDFASVDRRSDAQAAFLGMARQLARSGTRRGLAGLPAADAFDALLLDMPNFREVIEFYTGQAALLHLSKHPYARFPPTLLLGPPGVGKTYFARRLAELIGSQFRLISMASQTAGWVLSGLDASWASGKPGMVFKTLASSRMGNPVMLVDELDKASQETRYNVLGGLYSLWEADTAREFVDEFAGVPIDTSGVIWVATANDESCIPRPLLSRLAVFEVQPPDRLQCRRIVASLFARVCGAAPFENLSEEMIQRFVDLPPRPMQTRIRAAVGHAASRARAEGQPVAVVRPEDDSAPARERTRRVGFM